MTGILESTVYLSVTALVILLFKWIFKNKLSAKWHVLIWMLLAVRLVLPSLPESSFSIFNAFDIPEANTQVYEQARENTEELSKIVPDINAGAVVNVNHAVDKQTDYTDTAWNTAPTPAEPNVDHESFEADGTQTKIINAEVVIRNVACIGSLVLFLYFVLIYVICICKNSVKPRLNDIETMALLEECKKKVGVKRRVYVVNNGENPMLMGLIRPTIVLPDGYTVSEKKDILIHELCHLKSGDIYLLWLAMIVLCLNWYNPIMWGCFFTFRRDVEVYCDERVLKYVDSKKAYAALLVKTALKKNSFIAGTTSLQNGEKEVERRVKYMAYFKKPHYIWTIVIVLIAVLIGVLCLTNPVGNVQEDNTVQIYTSFINGTETVEIRGENYSLTELVDSVGTVNQSVYYYFHDMNGDGVDELHIKTSMAYFIFTIKDEKMSLWYRGTIYENPTEDGNIIYIRHGGAPTNQTVIYISLDENGNEVYRDTVAKYDENEDGTFETFFRDNEKISELEYSEISGKYLSRNIIYLAKWTELKPQQVSDVSKEATDDYSEVYDKDGKVMESSKNFLLEDRTDEYYYEVYDNDGDVLHSDSSDKCPVFIHLDGPLYELRMPQGTSFRDSYFFNVETGYKSEKYGRPFYITNGVIAYLFNLPTFESVYPSKTGELTVIQLFNLYDRVLVDTVDADFLKESTSHLIEYVDDTHISVTYYTDDGQKENKKIINVQSLSGVTAESDRVTVPISNTTPKPVSSQEAPPVNENKVTADVNDKPLSKETQPTETLVDSETTEIIQPAETTHIVENTETNKTTVIPEAEDLGETIEELDDEITIESDFIW